MARERGTFNFSANLEVKKQGALDSRLVIQTYAELTQSSTWADTDSKVWLYDGMIVSVVADSTGKNGVYMLTDKERYNEAGSWTRIDAGAAEKLQVIDNLTSDLTTAALSARQGKVLKGMIDENKSEFDEFVATKGQPNGFASLDENGKIPANQLNGDLGRVVGIEKFLDTQAELGSDPNASSAEEGDKYFCKDVNKVFTKTSSGWDAGVDPRGNTIYNHRLEDSQGRTNVLYRWDGSVMVEISASLALGETEGTAYEGSKGKALRTEFDSHKSNKNNPHGVTKAQVGLDKVENLAPSELPVSTATQSALDSKVDKVPGSSLVEDTEISKLKGLSSQATINAAIADAKKAGTDADSHLEAVSGQSTGAYVANEGTNYISEATSLNDADLKLDAQIKKNADAIASLTGEGGGGSIKDQIDSAISNLKGGASEGYDTLKEIEDIVKKEISDRTGGDSTLDGKITALDTAVSQFKNKTVSATLNKPGNDTSLPTTKAVVDYITTSTNGLANSMTYAAKSGDPTKMELKLISVDGSTLSTVELDKENFISNFEKREATSGDHSADPSINEGDPILVVTTVNGQIFRVNLKELVDVYTGQATNSINTTVSGYTIKADLKLDSATQNNNPVKLSVGSNGLSADLDINSSTNGTKGITLTKSGSGIAAELKIDSATNTANGISMTVGAEGLSAAMVWNEL